MIVTGLELPLYFVKNVDNQWETVYLNSVPNGLTLYSLETFEYDGKYPSGYYWYDPERISTTIIAARKVELVGEVFVELIPKSGIIYINGTRIELTFSAYTTVVADVVAQINQQVIEVLGSDYTNFAQVYNVNRIRLATPNIQNSSIVIGSSTIFSDMGFQSGEYYGDLPFEFRSYVEEEQYLLMQETVTPNNGDRTNKFIPLLRENNFAKNIPEFDRNIIENNPRLSILVDSFAYGLDTLDKEIDRTIDELKIDNMGEDIIEYVAYLFDIDLNQLLQSDNIFSAREILRSLMKTIQIKGASESFFNMMNAIGFDSMVKEFRQDGTEILPLDISDQDIEEYYKRFLISDSEYRNPVVNYGTLLNTESELPAESYNGEVVKLLLDNKTVQYNGTTGVWDTLYDTIYPINSQGNDSTEEIHALNWLFRSNLKEYEVIKEQTYNDINLLTGFRLLSGDGTDFTNDFYTNSALEDDAIITNAFAIGNAGNYDLSNSANQGLEILINEERLVAFDFTNYPSRIPDISDVSVAQIKQVIEQTSSEIQVSQTSVGEIVIASTRYGTRSSIRIIDGNEALGYTTGTYIVANKASTTIRVTAGTANITDTAVAIPEVTIADTDITIRSVTDDVPLDGIYTLWLETSGDIIISSTNNFYQAVYDPDIGGYITKEFDANNSLQLGTVRVISSEIARFTPNAKQQDYSANTDLTQDQIVAVRSFVRSKLATSGLDALPETGLPYPTSFYYRDGERNTTQTGTPGVLNEVELEISTYDPATTTIDDALAKQIDTIITYVRPVHLAVLDILVNLAPFIGDDIWYPVSERANVGFWDGSQIPVFFGRDLTDIIAVKDILVAPYNTLGQAFFYLGSDPILNQNGSLATVNDIVVKSDGVVLDPADYTLNASTGLIEITSGIPVTTIFAFYYTTDGKFSDEIDIRDDLITAYGLGDSRESAWFTNGEALAETSVTPSSGENHDPFNNPADRENTLLTEYSDIQLGYDSYDTDNDDYTITTIPSGVTVSYNSLKKPMIGDYIHLLPIQKSVSYGTAKAEQNLVLFDNTIAYYDAPKPYNLGADYFVDTDITNITPSYGTHLGYHNGMRFNNANNISQVRDNQILFLGSENYSGGYNGTTNSGDITYNSGGTHRGHGIYAATLQILIDNSQATEITRYIENGIDLITGDSLATIEADTANNQRLILL